MSHDNATNMINAKEVRLGNFIYGTDGSVKEVTIEAISYLERYTGINQARGIVLTEDWLFKFGFRKYTAGEKEHYVEYFEKGKLTICDFGDGLIMSNAFAHGLRIKLETVHQLQNLYFSLTNEEVVIVE